MWDILLLAPAGASALVAYTIWRTNQRYLKRQTVVDSARLIVDLDRLELRGFQEFIHKRSHAGFESERKNIIDVYLGRVDMICMFHEGGLIDDRHMGEQYEWVIRECCKDGAITHHLRDNTNYAALKRRMVQLEPDVFNPPS